MTNTVAVWLGAAVIAAILADQTLNDGAVSFFLALRIADLIDWLAFWR